MVQNGRGLVNFFWMPIRAGAQPLAAHDHMN